MGLDAWGLGPDHHVWVLVRRGAVIDPRFGEEAHLVVVEAEDLAVVVLHVAAVIGLHEARRERQLVHGVYGLLAEIPLQVDLVARPHGGDHGAPHDLLG